MGRVAEALARSGQATFLPPLNEGTDHPQPASTARIARLRSATQGPQPDLSADPGTLFPEEPTVPDGVDPCLTVVLQPESFISEQYRAVRTRLLSHNPACEPWTLGVTSSNPREGKSVTTLNLGFALSELRHLKVALVDADLRNSSLAKLLNLKTGPGLAEVIRGEVSYQEAICPTHQDNVSLIPAGSSGTHNPAKLLGARRTEDFLRFLRREHHYVLIDMPPAHSFADVGILGQLCTGVILVVRMNRTSEPAAKRTVRLLQSNKINVLGCVLAAIKETSPLRYNYY